jgi:hypothetical protein
MIESFEAIAVEGADVGGAADRLRGLAEGAEAAAGRLRELRTAADIQDAFIGLLPGQAGPTQAEVGAALLEVGPDTSGAVSELATNVGDAISGSVGDGLTAAMLGEGLDAADLLADLAGDLVQASLENVLQGLSDGIADVFQQLTDSIGSQSGLGGAFGQALAGAVGIGVGLLARELGGTSASASNDLVRTATQSAQATRGVVAGPTSIPVFQVGQQLEAALEGTNGLLEQILAAVRANPIGASASATGPSGAASDLSLTTPSLA